MPDPTRHHDGAAPRQHDRLDSAPPLEQQLDRARQQVHELVTLRMHFPVVPVLRERELADQPALAEAIAFVLTRSERADVVNLRIEPRVQKTA